MLRGKITAIDTRGLYVQTADWGILGPCQHVGTLPTVGASVLVADVGDNAASPDLIVLGAVPGVAATGWVTSAMIANGTIVDADINTTAAIAQSKIAGLGAWTAYTPTLTASTTNPTGWTQTGYYCQVGKLVVAKFVLTAGGAMTAGSGAYRVALPVPGNTTIGDIEAGVAAMYDANTGGGHEALPTIAAAGYATLAFQNTHGGAFALTTHATPWTWAASDVIRGTITYEAA